MRNCQPDAAVRRLFEGSNRTERWNANSSCVRASFFAALAECVIKISTALAEWLSNTIAGGEADRQYHCASQSKYSRQILMRNHQLGAAAVRHLVEGVYRTERCSPKSLISKHDSQCQSSRRFSTHGTRTTVQISTFNPLPTQPVLGSVWPSL